MEFVPVEVYAAEGPTAKESTTDSGDNLELHGQDDHGNNSHTEEDAGRDHRKQQKRPASGSKRSRLQRILDPDYLPSIVDKALVFESFRVVPDKGVFGGRHDGLIMQWKIQQSSSVTPLNVSQLRGHSGAVLTLEFCASLGREGLLFSGSADRSVKIWDPWRGSEAEQQLHGNRHDHFCVQTLPAHQASVTCLKLLTQQQRPGLVSCSVDHSIKIWYPAEGRGLLLYPWFVLAQTISLSSMSCWPTCLCIRDAATSCSLFVGDSSGCVSHYTSGLAVGSGGGDTEDNRSSTTDTATINNNSSTGGHGSGSSSLASKFQFTLKRKHTHFHTLGVLHLQLISENNFVVSLGFDHKAHILDSMSGSVSSTITNRNATRFTCCAWDPRSAQCLFLGDAMGFVHVWNVFDDKWVKKEKLMPRATPLVAIHIQPAVSDWLFAGVAHGMKQWRINRDAGYGECAGHTDAIVGFAVLRDEILVDQRQLSQPLSRSMTTCSRFFSGSLDNTLRCWDAYDMKAAFGFEERQSEITCLVASQKFAKILTGHESGFIKVWGNHTGQFVIAPLPSKSAVTCLTTGMVRDQEFVVAGDVDDNLFIWEMSTEGLSLAVSIQVSLSSSSTTTDQQQPTQTRRDEISALLFCKGDYLAPHGGSEFVVIGYQTGYLAIWSFAKKALIKAWKAHGDAVTSLTRHGCFVFSGSDDTTLRMWNCINLTDPYELGVLRPPGSSSSSGTGSPIVAVDVVPESGAVLSATADGTIIVWDYKDMEDTEGVDFGAYGKILHHVRHNHQIRCMKYWPAKKAIIYGTNEGKVLVLVLPAQVFWTPEFVTPLIAE